MSAVKNVVVELRELEELLVQCSRCGTCQSVCPLYKKDRQEHSVARGKMFLIEAIYEGRLEKAEEVFQHLDYCLLCGRCKRECPSGVKTDEIFLRAKAILRQVKKMPAWQKLVLKIAMGQPGLLATLAPLFHIGLKAGASKVGDGLYQPRKFLRAALGELAEKNLPEPAAQPLTARYRGLQRADHERRRVIFYPGCAVTLLYPHWGEAIIETLRHYGISVYLPEVNRCCGIPSATMGEMGLYKEQVGANFDWLAAIDDADTVITCCPTCEYGLNDMGPTATGRRSGKRFVDIIVFLEEELGDQLPTGIPLPGKSTLHIPCHYDHAKDGVLRNFIRNRFATDYQELANQSCCGFGGTFNLKNYGHSQQVGKSKTDEIKERGFHHLFAPCPGCAMQLSDACATSQADIQASHPVLELYHHLRQ